MSKLSLHAAEAQVSAAESDAAGQRIPVSSLPGVNETEVTRLAPRTRSLAKCIPKTEADAEDYIDYLERKHS